MRDRGKARLGLGTPRDVVLIDATGSEHDLSDIRDSRWIKYVDRAGWDPRGSVHHRAYLVVPTSIQAWREVDEQMGRTIMKHGVWLADLSQSS